eukprot:TRINITY_DN3828_c1_g1_i2.p1 TRINITY_DN3828_c1_g1~~TRINITY_DN3828_c1_g1_i2.p1  ORF type:complete len:460 (+),score=92.93 TRINITY_DN3828_c1_g1_i2:47-1381(+)
MTATDRWHDVQKHCWGTPGIGGSSWSEELQGVDWGDLKILVIGAGGLGCEILKDLALIGFKDIEVIDMDTIDLSNLNRQFLFREKDIGKSKSEVASKFVMDRVADVNIKPHHGMIQDMSDDFYLQFQAIILGLDSLTARRWINAKVASLAQWEYDEESNSAKIAYAIPLIDGGTEGFKGHARVVMIGETACIESTEWMFPPQVTFPLCTLENVPRLPEHCVAYIKVKEWERLSPFGEGTALDGDNPDHIVWVAEKAAERGQQFGITGITFAFTQGVVKNIIPAIASTNAIIAATCCNEVLKMATGCNPIMNNYFMYNGNSIDNGIYGQIQSFPTDDTCLTSRAPTVFKANPAMTPRQFIDSVVVGTATNQDYETYSSSAQITLQSADIGLLLSPANSLIPKEETSSLGELSLGDGAILVATDPTFWRESNLKIMLHFSDDVEMK